MALQPSTTKRGPGRRHKPGHQKATPKPSKGAGFGFEQHHAEPAKRLRRANVKALGRRQSIKAAKAQRREALPAGLVSEVA